MPLIILYHSMPLDSSFSGVSLISLGDNDHIQVTIHRNGNDATDDDRSDWRDNCNPKNRFRSLFHRTFSRHQRRRRNSVSDANISKQQSPPPVVVSTQDHSPSSLILIRPRKQQQQQQQYTDDVSRVSTSSRLLPPPVVTPRRHLSTTFEAPLSLVPVLQALRAVNGYAGEIVTTNDLEKVLVKETRQPEFVALPTYISTTGRRYTEATCRDWFRAVCERVQILHQHHTVHRNLHLSHVLYDPIRVRSALDVVVARNTHWSWCVCLATCSSLSHTHTHTLLHPCIS